MERAVKNALETLGLEANASPDQIKAAYKRMALKWHPDRHQCDKEVAAKTFIEISKAYHTLIDELEFPLPPGLDTVRKDPHKPTSSRTRTRPPTPVCPPVDHRSESVSSSDSGEPLSDWEHIIPLSYVLPDSNSDSARACNLPPYNILGSVDPQPYYFYNYEPRLKSPVLPPLSLHAKLRKSPRPVLEHQETRFYRHGHVPSEPRYAPTMPEASKHTSRSHQHSFHPTMAHSTSRPKHSKPGRNTATAIEKAEEYYPATRAFPHSDDWICPVKLTLSELFTGKTCRFRLARHATSTHARNVEVDIHVRPGTRDGTTFICKGMGNERKDGSFQNIVFVVEEVPHDQFARLNDDLMLDVRIPRPKSSKYHPNGRHDSHGSVSTATTADEGWDDGELRIVGLDGEEYTVDMKSLSHAGPDGKPTISQGLHVIVGAGMPIKRGNRVVGRGDLLLRWEFVSSHASKWRAFKNLIHEVVA